MYNVRTNTNRHAHTFVEIARACVCRMCIMCGDILLLLLLVFMKCATTAQITFMCSLSVQRFGAVLCHIHYTHIRMHTRVAGNPAPPKTPCERERARTTAIIISH